MFYSLNNTSDEPGGHRPPSSQTAQTQPANPAAPPGMRDVTPAQQQPSPGMTTGAATNRPTPPQDKS